MIRDWLNRVENLLLRRGFKSAEYEGESDEFCPRCHATLALQKGFDPNLKYWICKGCGEMLINPDIDRYPLHVARTIDWVSNNYMLPLTVREIAEHFHYHPSYISSEMKKYTGLTLIAYIHSVRMNVAKSLLANYDIPVAEVARQSGYTDEKYFIRVFRRTQGITPGEYRKSFALRKQID